MRACVRVRACVRARACVRVRVRMFVRARVCARVHMCVCVCVCVWRSYGVFLSVDWAVGTESLPQGEEYSSAKVSTAVPFAVPLSTLARVPVQYSCGVSTRARVLKISICWRLVVHDAVIIRTPSGTLRTPSVIIRTAAAIL